MTGIPEVYVSDPFGRGPDRMLTAASASLADMVAVLRRREGWASRKFRIWVGGEEVTPDHWDGVVPGDGEYVLIAPLPQYESAVLVIKAIVAAFQAAVAETASATAVLSSYVAPGLITAAGVQSAIYGVLTGVAAGALSSLLSNHPGGGSATYSITGASNQADPDGFCPVVLGRRRVVPRLAASTWTIPNGDNVDLIMLVQWHVGRCQVSDLKLGDVPLANYKGVTVQHRLSPTDPFPDLYPSLVREKSFSSLMVVHDVGPVQRRTEEDTTKISIDLAWPMGLAWNGKDEARCDVMIQYRAVGASDWIAAPVDGLGHGVDGSIKILEMKPKPFRRNFSWDVPKGQYDVQVTRTWPDAGGSYPRLQDQVYWVCMRSHGAGRPVTDDDLPISAIRITATDQLSGQIQDLNGIVEPLIPKWNSVSKTFGGLGTSRNPGEQMYWLATGKQNARPMTNRTHDASLGAFAELCTAKGWKCDTIIDADMSEGQALRLVASAGRAFPVWEDGLLSVSVDGVQDAPCQVFSGRNVKNFTGTVMFPDELHGVHVGFYDETSGYEQQVRTVYASGYDATNANLFERIDAPTKTDPNEAWIVGWRYLAARVARPEIYEFDCDLEGLVVRWGKRIDIAHSCMAVGIRGARITSLLTRADGYVTGFVIDEDVPMEVGKSYVFKVQRGSSVGLYNIVNQAGTTDTLVLQTPVLPNNSPVEGNHGIFGIAGMESMSAIVIGIATRAGKDSHITAIPYAPELQADAGEIPVWDAKITRTATEDGLAVGHVGDTTQKAITDQKVADLQNQYAGGPPDGSVTGPKIADGTIDPIAKFIAGMDAIKVVTDASLPTTKVTNTVFWTVTSKLYTWDDATHQYKIKIDTADLTGSIVAAQIADASLTTAKFAAGIEPVTIVTGSVLPATKSTSTIFLTGTGKLYRWDATAGAYVASVATTDLAGTIATGQIADGAITAAKIAAGTITATQLASSLSVPTVVSTLPASGGEGQLVVLTTDGKLYRYHAGAWTASVPTVDLSGTISGAQIAAGTITGSNIASATITANQIAASAIDATKFASGIEPVTVVTGALPATKSTTTIYFNGKLYRWDAAGGVYTAAVATTDLSGLLTGGQIAASTVTGSNIAVGSITGTQLAAASISAAKLSGSDSQNMVLNPTSEDTTFTAGFGSYGVRNVGAQAYSGSFVRAIDTQDANEISTFLVESPAVEGESFYQEAMAKVASGGGDAGFWSLFRGANGALLGGGGTRTSSTSWTLLTNTIGPAPAGTVYVSFYLIRSGAAGTSFFDNLVFRKMTGTGQIMSGAVTSDKIADASLTTSKFAAGLEPVSIVTGALPTSKSTSAIVYGGELYRWNGSSYVKTVLTSDLSGSVIGSQIAANTITASKLLIAAIDANGNLAAASVGAAQIAAGTIVGSNIAAQTITASNIAADTITANQIAAGAIGASELAANSVSASNIVAGTIVSSSIAAATITGSNIAAGTITAANIAADTITAGQIASGAVSTDELAANAVTAAKIYGATITGDKIAGSTITGSNIAAGTITATNLTAYTITAAQIASSTITGDRIAGSTIIGSNVAAGTITGSNIAAQTITAANIAADTITAGQIAAGAIGASEIAAGSVTADKLYVGDTQNMVLNPTSEDPAFTSGIGAAGVADVGADAYSGTKVRRVIRPDNNEASNIFFIGPAVEGEYFYGEAMVRNVSGTGSSFIYMLYFNAAGAAVWGQGAWLPTNDPGGWIKLGVMFGPVPAGVVLVQFYGGRGGGAGTTYHDNLVLRKANTGSLIVDGAITASKIAAGTITADRIAANALTSGQIAASTITGSNIAGATITGANIAGQTITAANIAADTITAGQIAAAAIGTSELASGAVTTGKLYVGDSQNMVLNPTSEDTTFTAGYGANGVRNVGGNAYAGSYVRAVDTVGAGENSVQLGEFPVVEGEYFYQEAVVRSMSGAGAASGFWSLFFDGNSNIVGGGGTTSAATVWTRISNGIGPAPAGTVKVSFYLIRSGAAGTSYYDALVFRKMSTGSLIVDGAITATKIAAATITAAQIASATVTGTQIAGQTITAANIATDTITAGQIQSGAIGTDELAAGAVTAAKIYAGTITANEIAANTITGAKIAAGTITASNIASGAITADMITTGTLNAALITVTNLSAASLTAGTIAVARLPGLTANSFWVAGNVTAYDITAPADSFSELFTLGSGGCVAWGVRNIQTQGFSMNSASATVTAECRIVYKPQTSSQVYVRGGFRASPNWALGSWTFLTESECRVSTGSNSIYQTLIIRCRIPVGAYTAVQPWLHNTSGDNLHIYNVTMEIQQTSA
jgi:hypothetical protein